MGNLNKIVSIIDTIGFQMNTLHGIHAFSSVVEHGSFTAAAKSLGQTKSAVSKQVAALEEHLGVRLLNRTTRHMNPTEIGQAFHERCRRIISELEEAERAVADLHAEPRGTLRVNAPMSFGVRHLAATVADFMHRHPELEVHLDLNDRLVDVVEEGYDVVIRITRLPDSSLIARKLAPFTRSICASPAYWEKYGRPKRPEDLQHHQCLLYTYLLSGNDWTFSSPEGETKVRVSGNFRANNGDALLSAARSGLGVLNTPNFIAFNDIRNGDLEPVLTSFADVVANIYAIYPHNRHLSAKVRLFVDFLVERFGPIPQWDIAQSST